MSLTSSTIELFNAVRNGDIKAVSLLCNGHNTICFEDCDKDNQTPLMIAAAKGDTVIAKKLLNAGACPTKEALKSAIVSNHLPMVHLLVESGAQIHYEKGFTPLHWAVWYNRLDMVQYFVSKRVDLEIKDGSDDTALMLAVNQQYKDIVEYLVFVGADVNTKNKNEFTPLMKRPTGDLSIQKCLLRFGADINAQNAWGYTPLMCAVVNGNFDSVRFFVERGAQTHLVNKEGENTLMVAIRKGRYDMVKYFAENVPNTFVSAANKKQMIKYAKKHQRLAIYRLLNGMRDMTAHDIFMCQLNRIKPADVLSLASTNDVLFQNILMKHQLPTVVNRLSYGQKVTFYKNVREKISSSDRVWMENIIRSERERAG